MQRRANQCGYLMVAAVILIVIVAFLAVALSTMLASNVNTTVNNLGSMQGLYQAEGGLEYEQRRLARNLDWYRSVTDPMATTTLNIGSDSSTVKANLPATLLRRNLTSGANVVCVYTLDRFPATGSLLLDDDIASSGEFVTYTGTTSSHASCGSLAAFTGVARGQSISGISNAASAHTRSDRVYPVTTLVTNLAASCASPATFQITAHSKFLSAGTLDIEGEEIGYANSNTAAGVMTLTGVQRCQNGTASASHNVGAPVTPMLWDGASPDYEAEATATGTVGAAVREMRKTIQR
jgi:hypothetical protein